MTWGVLNAAILVGLMGATLPVLIHLLNRRRGPVVDWGAMQFLEPGRRARRRIRLAELLLMAARMGLLALVVLALARPFWAPRASTQASSAAGIQSGGPPRDVVLVLDVSASMERQSDGVSALARATSWARTFVRRCRPGDSIAVVLAGDGVRPLIDPPAFDPARVDAALESIKSSRGSSDLPAALSQAFRVLERTKNPGRDVIVLTDRQRFPWRPGELSRWALLKSLRARLPIPPRIWSIAFDAGHAPESPNASVGRVAVSRVLVTPGMSVEITTTVDNAGPGPYSGAAELLVDGHPAPGPPQSIGPVAAGGRAPLSFRTSLAESGSHLLAVRLLGGDSLPSDDLSEVPVQVVQAIPVLLVNGEPGLEPFSGETDFLRAALAPSDDETPPFRVSVITPEALTTGSLADVRVVVLANVDRLSPEQSAVLGDFVEAGGGLLVAPGDRTDSSSFNNSGWMPATLGQTKGTAADRKTIAHPAPRSFSGALMTAFGQGDAPALAEADFFAYHVLVPLPGAAVLGRLDTGDPWVIERKQGRGRILAVATPLDAEAGTLPVNPDFVPLTHEWIGHLAGGSDPLVVRAGEPLMFPLYSEVSPRLTSLPIETPGGTKAKAEVVRGGALSRARFDDTTESGIYRLSLPDPPGGSLYGAVSRDDRESNMAPLDPAEAVKLADGWPLFFHADPNQVTDRLFAPESGSKHEIWRIFVLAALAGLCLEIYLTRRLLRTQSSSVVGTRRVP